MRRFISSGILLFMGITGCTWQEVKEASYHAGQDIQCVQETRHHPEADVRSAECYSQSPSGSYSKYLKEKEQLEKPKEVR